MKTAAEVTAILELQRQGWSLRGSLVLRDKQCASTHTPEDGSARVRSVSAFTRRDAASTAAPIPTNASRRIRA